MVECIDLSEMTTEPDQYDYTTWALEYREAINEVLDEAGASEYFKRLLWTHDPGRRHSNLMTLYRHHASADTPHDQANAPNVSDAEEAARLGGGFFEKMWNGHLFDAFIHADGNNRPLMKEVFDREEIIAVGMASDSRYEDYEYMSKIVNERW